MTGWRLGWLVLPPGVAATVAKLIEFNSSCAPVFVQRGALAALAMADDFVPALVERLRACRDVLVDGLAALPGVTRRMTAPGGSVCPLCNWSNTSPTSAVSGDSRFSPLCNARISSPPCVTGTA